MALQTLQNAVARRALVAWANEASHFTRGVGPSGQKKAHRLTVLKSPLFDSVLILSIIIS